MGRTGAVGAFCPNLATYLPSPPEKRSSVLAARMGHSSSSGALSTLPALWGGEVRGARALQDLAPGHAVHAAVAGSGPFPRPGSAEPSPVPVGQCWPRARANPRLSFP